MKKTFLMSLVVVLFACNSNESTDATRSDSTVTDRDNSINRDPGVTNDTIYRRDSISRNPR